MGQIVKIEQPRISDILERLSITDASDDSRGMVERAYHLAQEAHQGQTRESGEPYIQHPLAVSFLLSDLGLGAQTVAAGLLHDVVEDSDTGLERLRADFGDKVASLVDGVTKLDRIEQVQIERFASDGARLRDEHESESLRKMFIAMGDDVRVVLVKLADRLHNMRTLSSLPVERQRVFARETLDIFAPLANRLGVWQWKWELEDLGLRYLRPEVYAEIASLVSERRPERERDIQRYIQILKTALDEQGVRADITGRPKHIYSIYRKMERKIVPFGQIYDVRGTRVTTDTIPDCYRVLGAVHGLWNPIPGEFDDYIATPKDNLYQSLHTGVICEDAGTLEIQIRTNEMHYTSEFGVAAHWRYKEGREQDKRFEAKIAWLRSQMDWGQDVADADEFVSAMKSDVFQDRVYTFSPKGKLIDLPAGATPIDFAYHIHTEIGHRCRGAKVNGKMVPLHYRLRTGDRVEIVTGKRSEPGRDWLNPALAYVQTARTRSKIRQWFRHQDREKNIAQGREVVERVMKRLGAQDTGHETVAKRFRYDKLDDFHAAVGFGDINSGQIANRISEMRSQEEDDTLTSPIAPPPPSDSVEGIQVRGTGGLLTRLARCCHPLPGDEIVGYVTRGRGITVHRQDCPNVLRLDDKERLIEVSWGTQPSTVPVAINITAYDRTKLLNEISGIIGGEEINIASVRQSRTRNISHFYITVELQDIAQLDRILAKIERLPNVTDARRHLG